MANKRDLKKSIAYVCADIAGECIFAQQCFEGIDVEKMDEVIIRVALLQDEATKRISVDYDKKPGDFKANKAEYRKGRKAYFKSVAKAIAEFMNSEVEDIVKQMNALMPEAQKQDNKQAAK